MDDIEHFSSIEVMRRLFEKDYENKVCVECKCPMPSYVSINNAILLCDKCADKHMKLGYNVSKIFSIKLGCIFICIFRQGWKFKIY